MPSHQTIARSATGSDLHVTDSRARSAVESDPAVDNPATNGCTEQLHLRLSPRDATALRTLAEARGQTLSGAVKYLLNKELKRQV
jgi:hypothetical protein